MRTAAAVGEAMVQIEADHLLDLLIADTQIQHGSCVDVLCNVGKFDYGVVCMSSDERDYQVKAIIAAGFPFYCKLDEIQKLVALVQSEMRNVMSSIAERFKKLKRIIRSKIADKLKIVL